MTLKDGLSKITKVATTKNRITKISKSKSVTLDIMILGIIFSFQIYVYVADYLIKR